MLLNARANFALQERRVIFPAVGNFWYTGIGISIAT